MGLKHLDRIVELAGKLHATRADVTRIEGELAKLLGDTTPDKPSPARKTGKRQPSAAHDQVVELAKAGSDPKAIAEKLGMKPKIVHLHLWRARKNGELPKSPTT